jgi:Flp pilus assembly protein TadD
LIELSWLLAASPDTTVRDAALAARLAARAAALTARRDAGALDALAAAQASAGDFARAVQTADAALALKPANAAEIAARRSLYQQQRPFVLAR